MHALTTYHWALIGRSNICKEGTALNIHCIPIHLAISGLDVVNVYGSAPELKQSSRTWQQKEAKFLVLGCEALPHSPTFSTVMSIYLAYFSPDYYFEWVEKRFKTQNFETKKCF